MSDLYLSRIRSWFLSSPPAEWALNRLRSTLIGALSQGPIPGHVAFEMDGNRRYARSHKIETIEGHHLGFEALARVRVLVLFFGAMYTGLTECKRC
jgi:ditrans,polycis-polyprenyl diphosphate synthase